MGVVGKLQVEFRWDYSETVNDLLTLDTVLYLANWDYMFGNGEVPVETGVLTEYTDRELQLKRWREKGCSR